MTKIRIAKYAKDFAEDKDLARDLRTQFIAPALDGRGSVVIDFKGVAGATQSFIHAMISEPIRSSKGKALDRFQFKNCNDSIKKIIGIVAEYSQDEDESS